MLIAKSKSSSCSKDAPCWQKFNLIHDSDKQFINIVICNDCEAIYKYNPITGNSTLNKHAQKCSNNNSKLTNFFTKKEVKLTSQDKLELKNAQSMLVIKSLSPFGLMDNEGFLNFANVCFKIGSKYGSLKSESILFSRKTISKEIYCMGDELQKNVKGLIGEEIIRSNSIAFTADIWSSRSRDSFLQIHAQWIDQHFKCNNVCVAMLPFSDHHTSENIKDIVEREICALSVPILVAKIVTDCGANMKLATSHMDRFDCLCHRLSTCLGSAWNSCIAEDNRISDLNSYVTTIITFINHKTDVKRRLVINIKDVNQTRSWRGLREKFLRIQKNIDVLKELSIEFPRLKGVFLIEEDLLMDLVDFLTPINSMFDAFEASGPTSHLVLPHYYMVVHHLKNAPNSMKIFANKLKEFIETKFYPSITNKHYMATLLSPNFRKFSFISDEKEKKEMHNYALLICGDVVETQVPDICDESKPTCKKRKLDESILREDSTDNEDIEEIPESEIGKYLLLKTRKFSNPLEFWAIHTNRFPILAKVARSVFSIPASSSFSERFFSITGKIARPDRCSLSPDHLSLLAQLLSASKNGLI